MLIFLTCLTLWFSIGVGIAIFVTIKDEDLKLSDIPTTLGCGLFGPIMIGLLFQEGYLKMPIIFSKRLKDFVILKKIKSKEED